MRRAALALATDDGAAAAELYAVLMSRAVQLPDLARGGAAAGAAAARWASGAVGVVPFHDMLNHATWARSNCDLLAGDASERGDLSSGADDGHCCLVLRASADVHAGGELLTPYHFDDHRADERARIHALLQYGMPPDATGPEEGWDGQPVLSASASDAAAMGYEA